MAGNGDSYFTDSVSLRTHLCVCVCVRVRKSTYGNESHMHVCGCWRELTDRFCVGLCTYMRDMCVCVGVWACL